MSEISTARLQLDMIAAAQAQKHVTHNEALLALDVLVQAGVLDRDLTAPPVSPVDGDTYIIAAGATGAWAAKDLNLAAWQDGAWKFHAPQEGWMVQLADEDIVVIWDGTAWQNLATAIGALQNLALLGVNATADATNKLAVAAAAVLLDNAGAGMQLKVNKNAAGDTGSLLFQTASSGRAEIGLTGDDDFHFKVSPDGATFYDAITIDKDTGAAVFPNTTLLKNHAANALEDSGRFCNSSSWISVTISSFVRPTYLTLFNSTTFTAHAKFIHNNSTFGGTGAALDADVQALVEKIKDTSHRRYGVEYYVASVTMGSGTGGALTTGGTTYHLSIFTRQQPKFTNSTFHAYMRVKTGATAISTASGQTIYIDGVAETSNVRVLVPADGWVSVRIVDEIDPVATYGYSPENFKIYQSAASDEFLLACPALVTGVADIDVNAGVIANANIWTV